MSKTVCIKLRHWQVTNPYGPGENYPANAYEGPVEKLHEIPLAHAALVLVHCWNVGEEGGPYPLSAVRPDSTKHLHGQWVVNAQECVNRSIAPSLAAAREVGMTIFHLATNEYADKYPQYAKVRDDPDLRPPDGKLIPTPRCIEPRCAEERYAEIFGADFRGTVWDLFPESFRIAKPVEPKGEEHVVVDGFQLSGIARRLGIRWLFYGGFMLTACLLDVPGAMREMNVCGYRVVALSDGTVSWEWADTIEHKLMTRAFLRYIEYVLGYSTESREFIRACMKTEHA